jgi:DNA-binding CsgD family transcriptional regulator
LSGRLSLDKQARMGRTTIWRMAGYGALLAAGTLVLQGLDYLWLARTQSLAIYIFLIAALFLGIGVAVGASALRRPAPLPFDGNPQALASLGISPRELAVLKELAAGHSNKEIADRLHVSPHTVKSHVGRLFEKLAARRRTDAIQRARELGIIP